MIDLGVVTRRPVPRARRAALLDAYGRPAIRAADATDTLRFTGGTAYEGGARGRRFAGYPAPNVGPNSGLLPSIPILRARTRHLLRNNPMVWRALRSRVANIIGTGMTVQSRIADDALRAQVDELFADWAEEADADGRTDFYGLQALIGAGVYVDGESFVRLRYRRTGDGLSVPLQLQVLEADHCPVEHNAVAANGNPIRAGIEFDKNLGFRVAYYLWRIHPAEAIGGLTPSLVNQLSRVPAEEVLHFFPITRAGQVRGEPGLSRIILRAFDKDLADDAALKRRQVAALFAYVITKAAADSASPTEGMIAGQASPLSGDPNDPTAFDSGTRPPDLAIDSGMTVELDPGEQIYTPTMPDEGASYEEFQRQQDLAIAAGCGTTYEGATGDFSNVNYTSYRAALLEMQRQWKQEQAFHFIPRFREIYRAWLRQAALAGAIDLPGFARQPRPFLRHDWIPDGWAWVDPLKEVLAFEEEVKAGFITKADVIASRGGSDDDVRRRRALELQKDRAAGVATTTDPLVPTKPTADPTAAAQGADGTDAPPAGGRGENRNRRSAQADGDRAALVAAALAEDGPGAPRRAAGGR